jgi:hypothetical protein
MAQNRHVHIRSIKRTHPDIRKLSRALIALAMAQAQAEADAQAQHERPPEGAASSPQSQSLNPADEEEA